jgi:alpha-1,6-mannosyltransferase
MTSVHLTNAYHATSGGIRTFYDALLEAGNREGRRVALIVPGATTEVVDRGSCGRIYVVAAPRAPLFDRRYRLLLPHRFWPGTASTIVGILRQLRPEIVEICDKYSLPYLAAMVRKGWHRRVRRPTLVGLSCERFDDNMAAYLSDSRAGRAFTRWYIRHVYGPPFDVHIANSAYTARELREALPDRPPGFIRVCPMGVDASGFGPGLRSADLRRTLLERCGGTDESVLLLYAGRIAPEKNVGLLVATMQALARSGGRDYRMVAIGDGPLAAWLRAHARGPLGGRLWVCGSLDRATLARYCASADVFVHPNPREPFGIGPLEAMASGVPVVVPATGGVLEYATGANAWLASPSADAFASAVCSAASGDPRRVAAARATALDFTWHRATRRYFAVYDEVHRLHAERWTRPVGFSRRLGNARRTMHA